jgi:hypothetical protein
LIAAWITNVSLMGLFAPLPKLNTRLNWLRLNKNVCRIHWPT